MTHINAFIEERDRLQIASDQAKREFDEAQANLEAHPDYVNPKKAKKTQEVEEPTPEEVVEEPQVDETPTKNKKSKNQ